MRVHVFQHVPFESLGSLSGLLVSDSVSWTRFYENGHLPDMSSFDLLVILGGPMSVNDTALFPWLSGEISFVRSAIDAGKKVLGICLGAQMIAGALGAKVYPNSNKEIGWFDIRLCECAEEFDFPSVIRVFHWHGETFDLPVQARRMYSSDATLNQMFVFGSNVFALQFHLEMNGDSLLGMFENCSDEIVPGRYVQSREDIAAGYSLYGRACLQMLSGLLSHLRES